jgi:hypothetical protein
MLLKPVMSLSRRVAATLATAAAAALLWGCGGDLASGRPAGPPLPPYTARDAQLFDDGVEAKALGFEISDSTAKDDRLLADRVEASDGVVRARVVTVTSKAEDSGVGLLLSLHAVETLTGRRAPAGDFTLLAPSKAPATGMLTASEGRLVGMTFVVFVRGFASEGEEPDGSLHFHLAPDGKDEQDKVRAASLGPLR